MHLTKKIRYDRVGLDGSNGLSVQCLVRNDEADGLLKTTSKGEELMAALKDKFVVYGKHAEVVRREFGGVVVGSRFREDSPSFMANIILPNFYRHNSATVENAPLYVLVPNCEIDMVWPLNVGDEFKYGVSFDPEKQKKLSEAVGIFKDTTCLYICLHPLSNEEAMRLQINALGM
ncbi:MAG: hypothetical protein Q7S15_00855 [bacterium]|nr:hypothetical protein [bacterium]